MTTQNDKMTFFVIGIGLGLLGGLLLAPRSGVEVRQDFRRRTTEGLGFLNQQAEKLRQRTEQAVNRTRDWLGRYRTNQPNSAESESPFSEEKPMT